MRSETFAFETGDGTELFVYHWLPDQDGAEKAVVQIAHGMAEHAGRYEELARVLTGEGYAVYANDHRGHGRTARAPEELGFFADQGGWDLVVDDMHRLTLKIKESHQGLPVFLLGHSMGSFLTRDYISIFGREIAGAVLSGTMGDPGILGSMGLLTASVEAKRRGGRAPSPLMHKLTFGSYNKRIKPARTDHDWLSRDSVEVDKYVADPLCGFVCTAGFYCDLLSGVRKIHTSAVFNRTPKDLPMYLFAGEMDPVGSYSKGVLQVFDAYKKAGLGDVSLKLYEGGRHEMLSETNRNEVYKDLVDWMNSHL